MFINKVRRQNQGIRGYRVTIRVGRMQFNLSHDDVEFLYKVQRLNPNNPHSVWWLYKHDDSLQNPWVLIAPYDTMREAIAAAKTRSLKKGTKNA